MNSRFWLHPLCLCAFTTATTISVFAQTLPENNSAREEEKTIVLSPFEVNTSQDSGYMATTTLAGSRLNTELRNTPSAISVMTKELLNDIGALTNEEALNYSLNAGREYTDYTGLDSVQQNDFNLQVRGFAAASLGRDYFSWHLATDSFNTERLDFSRGPNAILFGVGGPGGIVNTTTKRAQINGTTNQVELRTGSWSDYRVTADINQAVGEKFAVRANVVYQDKESWRDFEFYKLKAVALSSTYRPFKNTEIRAQGEYGDRKQIVAMPWPSADYSSQWLDAGSPITTTFAPVTGTATNFVRAPVFDPYTTGGVRISPWNGRQVTNKAAPSPSLGGNTKAFTDFSVIPKESNLGGPGATTNNYYSTYAMFVEQRLGPVTVELAYNHQEDSRRANYPIAWNGLGAFGDANALLPSFPLPDGTLQTNSGEPNPNAGKLYVQGQAQYRDIESESDTLRATLAYKLDLRERNLGLHQFSALASRENSSFVTDAKSEVNVTPTGTVSSPLDITHFNNAIYRRTYLDFSSDNPANRGAHDPNQFPIVNEGGVNSGFRRTVNTSNTQEVTTDSYLIAGQSSFWRDRFILTWGLRRDEQEIVGAGGFTRDPITREFSARYLDPATTTAFAGNTRTYGAVFWITKELGIAYNNSDNFVPQSQLSLDDKPIGPRTGTGEDFSVRTSFLEGRLNVVVTRYKLTEQNRFSNNATVTSRVIPLVNEIWEALGRPERALQSIARDSVDNAGKGWELELTANPTEHWRVMFNANQTDVTQSNTLPRVGQYIADNRNAWSQSGSTNLVPPYSGVAGLTNPTISDALSQLDAVYAGIRRSEGQVPRQTREYGANMFTAYTFGKQTGWLNGFTIGGGGNYRSAPVTGYDGSNNLAPIYGDAYTLYNLMLAKSFRVSNYTVKFQLNVDNLFDHDDLIITDKDDTGTYRYLFQQPRRWSLTASLKF